MVKATSPAMEEMLNSLPKRSGLHVSAGREGVEQAASVGKKHNEEMPLRATGSLVRLPFRYKQSPYNFAKYIGGSTASCNIFSRACAWSASYRMWGGFDAVTLGTVKSDAICL